MDGIRFQLWEPPNEDEFEQIVGEHAAEIFGNDAKYFDLKHKLASKSGTGSIPDGYVISLVNKPEIQIIEMELASHSLQHIISQIVNIISGIGNPVTQQKICNIVEDGINEDGSFENKMAQAIKPLSIHRFLSNSFMGTLPTINIIINRSSQSLEEAVSNIAPPPRIIEFQTYTSEGVGLLVHTHLFEPVHQLVKINPPIYPKVINEGEPINQEPMAPLIKPITIQLQPAFKKYPLIPIRAEHRQLFPGFREPFIIQTEEGNFETRVVGASANTGDPNAGTFIRAGIPEWSRHHPSLRGGDTIQIKVIEPKRKYGLMIQVAPT